MSEWISLKDQFPPENHFVLVFCLSRTAKPSSYSLALWSGNKWIVIGDGKSVLSTFCWQMRDDEEISHWMLLPKPPKKDDENKITIPATEMQRSVDEAYEMLRNQEGVKRLMRSLADK